MCEEAFNESVKAEDFLPLFTFKIPVNVIEGKFREASSGGIATRVFKYLCDNLSLKVWYNGGLDCNLEYKFTVVLSGFGKDYEIKQDWLGKNNTIRPIDRREVKEDAI